MTPEQQQEEISKAYLQAVCAVCGFAVGSWSQDHGAVDASVKADRAVGNGFFSKPTVDVQLKATRQIQLMKEGHLSWKLERAHYDRLRSPAASPHLLVVLLLEPELADCIKHTVDSLMIRKCAYWVKMTGMEDRDQDHITVKIPRENEFSPDQLMRIMEKVSCGEGGNL